MILQSVPYPAGVESLSVAPSLVSTHTFVSNAGGSGAVNLAYPTGVAADLIAIIHVTLHDSTIVNTINTPSGFTQLVNNSTNGDPTAAVFWKRLTGSESGTVSITAGTAHSGTDCLHAEMTLWADCLASGSPFEAVATTDASSCSMTGASVTITGPNRQILHFGSCLFDRSVTPAAGYTQIYDHPDTSGADAGSCLLAKRRAATGNESSATHFWSENERYKSFATALKPAVDGAALFYNITSYLLDDVAATITPSYYVAGTPVFTIEAGSLPAGLSLNSSSGVISGTPTTPGTSSGIQIKVSDGVEYALSNTFSLTVTAIEGRYWRLYITGINGGAACGISEVEMFLTSGGANQCTGGTAGASSTWSGSEPASEAFDGVKSTGGNCWASGQDLCMPQWIRYDFGVGTSKAIRQVKVQCRGTVDVGQAPSAFLVQFSSDNSVWTTAWSVSSQTGWTNFQTRTFDMP